MAVAAFSAGGGTTAKKTTKKTTKKEEEKSFLEKLFGGSTSKDTSKESSKTKSSKTKSSTKTSVKKSSSSTKTTQASKSQPKKSMPAPQSASATQPASPITDQLTPSQAEALAALDQAAANAARAQRNTFSPEYLAAQEAAKTKPDYLAALKRGNQVGNLAAALNPGLYLPGLVLGAGMALGSQQPSALNPNPIPVSSQAPNPVTGEMQTIYTYDPVTGAPTPQGFASPDYQLLSNYRFENPTLNWASPSDSMLVKVPSNKPYTLPSYELQTKEQQRAAKREAERAKANQNFQLYAAEPESAFVPMYSYPELAPGEQVVGESLLPGGSRMVKFTPTVPKSAIPEPWTPLAPAPSPGPPAAQPTTPTELTAPSPSEPPPVDQWAPPPGMSLEDALALAEALYGPQYAELLRQRLQSQSIDLLQRGFYGQLPGYNLLMDVQARTAAEQAAAERSYAEQLLQSEQAAQQEYERMKAEWELQNQQMDQASRENRQKSFQDSVNAIVNLIDTINRVGSSFNTSSTGTETSGTAETFAASPAAVGAGSKQASKQSVGLRQPISLNQPLQTYPQDLYTPPNVATRPIGLGVG